MDASSLKAQLEALCSALSAIAREHPNSLETLCTVARPQLDVTQQHAALKTLFENLSAVLLLDGSEFVSYLESPPQDAAGVLLLLDFRALGLFLHRVSFHHLILLSDPGLLPEKEFLAVRQFLVEFQRLLSNCDDARLEHTRQKLLGAPEYMQMGVLSEFMPQAPSNIATFLAATLLVPNEADARTFVEVIRTAGEAELDQLAKLLSHFDVAFLLELKEKLKFPGIEDAGAIGAGEGNQPNWAETGLNVSLSDIPLVDPEDLMTTQDIFQFFEQSELDVLEAPTNGDTTMDAAAWDALFPQTMALDADIGLTLGVPADSTWATSATEVPGTAPQPHQPPVATSTGYELRMAIQPPPQLVYQRIVKPNPTVMMVTGSPNKDHFVRATLVRADSDTEVVNVLEGTLVERISTTSMAQFRRLKIISTSQMQGTLFRLKFSLEVFEETFIPTGICIFSNPIEVFSHTQYVKPNRNAPTPPVILEVLPVSGKPGTRVAVIGNNFVEGDHLAVRFGEMSTRPRLHGPGTLICSAPSHQPAFVDVSVTNDGVHFTRSVPFQYL